MDTSQRESTRHRCLRTVRTTAWGLVVPSVVNGNTRLGVLRPAALVRLGLTIEVASDELVVSVLVL